MSALLAALLLTGAGGVLEAPAVEPPCDGRFVVEGRSSPRWLDPGTEILVLDGQVAIGLFCAWVPVDARAVRRGTVLIAEWPSCGGGAYGALRLRARLNPDCTLLRGVTRDVGSGYRRRFRARRLVE